MTDPEPEIIEAAPEDANAADRVSTLIQRALREERRVVQLEETLKRAKERLRLTTEIDLPEAFSQANTEVWGKKGGLYAQLVVDAIGDLPSNDDVARNPDERARREAIYDWCGENGHGGLVKHLISIAFDKDEDEFARETLERLEQERKEGRVSDVRGIHYQTFQAWVREQVRLRDDAIRRGVRLNVPPIPEELFGIQRRRFVKITQPKERQL